MRGKLKRLRSEVQQTRAELLGTIKAPAQRLVDLIRAREFTLRGQVIHITVSGGVGTGKSSTAYFLARLLRELGAAVHFEDEPEFQKVDFNEEPFEDDTLQRAIEEVGNRVYMIKTKHGDGDV